MTFSAEHILVAVDFGRSSDRAREAAIDLAVRFASRLTLVHVVELPVSIYPSELCTTVDLIAPIERAAHAELGETVRDVRRRVPSTTGVLRQGGAAHEILSLIDDLRPDLVVMGTHGRRGMSRLTFGSVAERVVRLSRTPVLTLREAPLAEGSAPASR